jgi:S-DNA-T family DNA segregation ATPase FtsK/SpoIIIE
MLYMPTEASKPKRLQGCFVSDSEVERLVYFWNTQRQQEAAPIKVQEMVPPAAMTSRSSQPEDPLLDSARELAEQHEHISTSFLQRKLHIGYPRAARIMEQLQDEMGGDFSGGEGEETG